MPVNYSTSFRQTTNAVSAAEFPLLLLEIDHADLTSPIRVVNDKQDVTSNAILFTAMGFRATLPDQKEKGTPKARISIDNIGKEMVDWLELSDGGAGATVRMIQIMRSAPDNIEWEITLNLTDVSMTPLEISGTLGYDDLLNQPAVRVTYDPTNAPGLY